MLVGVIPRLSEMDVLSRMFGLRIESDSFQIRSSLVQGGLRVCDFGPKLSVLPTMLSVVMGGTEMRGTGDSDFQEMK